MSIEKILKDYSDSHLVSFYKRYDSNEVEDMPSITEMLSMDERYWRNALKSITADISEEESEQQCKREYYKSKLEKVQKKIRQVMGNNARYWVLVVNGDGESAISPVQVENKTMSVEFENEDLSLMDKKSITEVIKFCLVSPDGNGNGRQIALCEYGEIIEFKDDNTVIVKSNK